MGTLHEGTETAGQGWTHGHWTPPGDMDTCHLDTPVQVTLPATLGDTQVALED